MLYISTDRTIEKKPFPVDFTFSKKETSRRVLFVIEDVDSLVRLPSEVLL